MDSEPTTSDEIEIARGCSFELKRGRGSYLRTAVRAFAGLPRLAGMTGITMRFEALKGDLLSYQVGVRRGMATGIVPVDADGATIADRLRETADAIERGIRTEDTRAFSSAFEHDRPWAFQTSPLLTAAIERAGVEPADYLLETHRRIRRRESWSRMRHGPAPAVTSAKRTGGRMEDPAEREDLPWDLPDHCVSIQGWTVLLHDMRIGTGSTWGRELHNGREAALSIRTVLPTTLRVGAVGMPLNRLADAPLLAGVDAPVTRIMRKGGSTVMLVDPPLRHMAPPPHEIAERISRMRDALSAIALRNADGAPQPDELQQFALL